MYISTVSISTLNKSSLEKRIREKILFQPFVQNKKMKRKIFLHKFVEANINRKDGRRRLTLFDCGIDIVKKSDQISQCVINSKPCFKVIGKHIHAGVIEIHIREDVLQKDKQLFLISIFTKK